MDSNNLPATAGAGSGTGIGAGVTQQQEFTITGSTYSVSGTYQTFIDSITGAPRINGYQPFANNLANAF